MFDLGTARNNDQLLPDVDAMSDQQLMSLLLTSSDERHRLDALEAHLLSALERRDSTLATSVHQTARWFAHATNTPLAGAEGRLRVAQQLHSHFRQFHQALREARISWEHCVSLVRHCNPAIADQLVDLQPELLEHAELGTHERFESELRAMCEQLDQQAAAPQVDDVASRSIVFPTPTEISTGDSKAAA